MTSDEETGIVQADIAEFENDTLAADSIETSASSLTNAKGKNFASLPIELLAKIKNALYQTAQKNAFPYASLINNLPNYAMLLIHAKIYDPEQSNINYRMKLKISENTTGSVLLEIIESTSKNEIRQTDLFEILNTPDILPVKTIKEIFPEIDYLSLYLSKNNFELYDTPYIFLLQADPDYRTFFAGVMVQARIDNSFAFDPQRKGNEYTFQAVRNVLTSERILAYANKIGEKKVLPYLQAVSEVGVVNSK